MTTTYVQRYDDDGAPCECDRCNSPAPTAEFRRNRPLMTEEKEDLCKFCASTMLGNVMAYRNQHGEDAYYLAHGLLQSLNLINNRITELMEKK